MGSNDTIESANPSMDNYPLATASVFSDDHFKLLNSKARWMYKPAGEYLFREGSRTDRLYIIRTGSVKVFKPIKDHTMMTLSLQFPGDLFGEHDPGGTSSYPYAARAIEDSVVGEIMQEDIAHLLRHNGAFALEYTAWMGTVCRIGQSKLRDYLHYGKTGALCALLLRLSNTYAGESQGYPLIDKWITNSEMAEMISTTRESVNRLLGELRSREAISTDQGKIMLTDIGYLRSCCRCEDCPKSICRM